MTLHEQYQSLLKNFVILHRKEIEALPVFGDGGDQFDYMPDFATANQPGFDKSKDPLNNPLIKKIIQDVYDFIWGQHETTIQVNLDGHFERLNGKTLYQINKENIGWNNTPFTKANILYRISDIIFYEIINLVFFSGKAYRMGLINLHDPNKIYGFGFYSELQCPFCDANIAVQYDSETLAFQIVEHRKKADSCPVAEFGPNKVYKFSISVPSKKLVFMNDIRALIDVKRRDKYNISINSLLGLKRDCEMNVEHNIAKFQVGNTCPTIYQHFDEVIIDPYNVGFPIDEETGDVIVLTSYEDKGSICTDLWAVYMTDYEQFLKYCKKNNADPKDFNPVIVEIEAYKVNVSYDFAESYVKITEQS